MKQLNHATIRLFLSTMISVPFLGQVLDPAPNWPVNGDISQYPKQFVFTSRQVGEYIVAIPNVDGSIGRLLKVPRHNAVDPILRATVSRDADGAFRYHYSLSNGASAAMPMKRWALAIDQRFIRMDLFHPTWTRELSADKLPGVSRMDHRTLRWDSPIGYEIAPGSNSDGFEIVSDLAPGFDLGAFYAATSTPELSKEDWDALPKDAAEQLKLCLGTAFDSQTRQVIGPRFSLSTDPQAVEENFLFGIRNHKLGAVAGTKSSLNEKLVQMLSTALADSTKTITGPEVTALIAASKPDDASDASALALTLHSLLKSR